MKLRFDPDLPHQRRAIDAAVGLFEGQRYVPATEALRSGAVVNSLDLRSEALLHRLRAVQARSCLALSDHLHEIGGENGPAFPNYSVEMETGTGKTYVYLRSALALAEHYGLRKYVVVVPSLAVREGVLSTFGALREHFAALHPRLQLRMARYDPRRIDEVREFASSGAVGFLVVTLDALNKQSNLVHRPNDRLQGRSPLALLQSTRPVLLLDEPQNMESDRSRETLALLRPLLALRYSATHRRRYALIHRLSPGQAQVQGLVKRVEVTGGFHPPGAEAVDAASALLLATMRLHLERQRCLRSRGIKVLSLFFIERVADYVRPGAWLPALFDRHYETLCAAGECDTSVPAAAVRSAYFARRNDQAIDSHGGNAAEDEAAYRLIMQSKERLLSLDEPVAFVFSHSALREGWDNPNVFQICSLARPKSTVKKRQEVGRGMRLAVDQQGRRVVDQEINVLTLVVGEDQHRWWKDLQAETEDSAFLEDRPARAIGPALRGAADWPAPQADRWIDVDERELLQRSVARLPQEALSGPETAQASLPHGTEAPAYGAVQRLLRRSNPPLVVPRRFIAAVVAAGHGPTLWNPAPDQIASVAAAIAAAFEQRIAGERA